ncbi:hypothetical protein [Chryseobacterium endalhagicum]|nr:hypothetical protein [Chryseobacterium endalhagicum]
MIINTSVSKTYSFTTDRVLHDHYRKNRKELTELETGTLGF